MPSFTIQLKEIIKDDYSNIVDIGLDWYPIFDETYRPGLNKKIIQHYWNREIGQETEFLFKFAMARKMNEIMPMYNQLYESEISRMKNADGTAMDPLSTIKLLTHNTGEDTSTGASNATVSNTTTNKSRTVSSDTPQVPLAGDGDYATSGVDATSSSTGDNTTAGNDSRTSNTTGDTTTGGYTESPILLVQRLRSAILNVDMMIIDELSELFMGVWDTGDEFTVRNGWGYL